MLNLSHPLKTISGVLFPTCSQIRAGCSNVLCNGVRGAVEIMGCHPAGREQGAFGVTVLVAGPNARAVVTEAKIVV